MNWVKVKQGHSAWLWVTVMMVGLVLGLAGPAMSQTTSSISSNFNGTPIPSGDYIWFNSVLRPSGLSNVATVFICINNQTISFTANGGLYTLPVPDAMITFNSSLSQATTTFDGVSWQTNAPSFGLAGNTFMAGQAYQVPSGLPGGIKNVTWQGNFASNTSGVSVGWKWAAAVYSSSGCNPLLVKPVDDNKASQYQNSDHAGTPEYCKQFVTGGATGGGGSNFTGSYSATAAVIPTMLGNCGLF